MHLSEERGNKRYGGFWNGKENSRNPVDWGLGFHVSNSRIISYRGVTIQPVYVVDPKRKSVPYELRAMENIIKCLKEKDDTKAQIADVDKIELNSIQRDEEISEAYRIIHSKTGLGSQHEWLAWLGKQRPGMEMGTEAGVPATSHIIDALETFCNLKIENNIGYVEPTSSVEGKLVLGWFKYPLITRYETDMLQQVKVWGYQDVMKNIWFCHTPINGKPCGCCHPCAVKMESDMQWLLPKKAQNNYHHYQKIKKHFGNIAAKVYRRILTLTDIGLVRH